MHPSILELLVMALLLLVAVAAHYAFWGWFYRPRRDFDALLTAVTSDGWRLAVAHFKPTGPSRTPVILCHGLAANRYNMSLPGPNSLATRLQAAGHDVFVCDLRGSGDSERPGPGLPRRFNFSFDDHLYRDAPALLQLALQTSGKRAALWVGHSMGGMVGLGLAQLPEGAALAGVIAIGSPTRFSHHGRLVQRVARIAPALTRGGRMRQKWVVRFFAPYLFSVGFPFGRMLVNPANVDLKLHRRVAYTVLGDVARPLLMQFAGWLTRDAWDTLEPPRDLRQGLKEITCPVLLLAGSTDVMCPLRAMEETLADLRTADKELVVFGRDRGDRHDYGHGDLIFGRHAPQEVFPYVEHWLHTRSSDASTLRQDVP